MSETSYVPTGGAHDARGEKKEEERGDDKMTERDRGVSVITTTYSVKNHYKIIKC